MTALTATHRYTRAIPEPVPFLFRHGAQIGGLRSFSRNQNNAARQVRMSPASTVV